MATGYAYKPLERARQEIRLLCFDSRLLTSEQCFKEPLCCTIKHISTWPDPLPEYYAVSYTWGDSKTRGTVLVDGDLVTIPQNAETALRHLLAKQIEQRNNPNLTVLAESPKFMESPSAAEPGNSPVWASTEIRFWLDAICVNQHDLEEKSWQLLLISDIYSQAQEACIWLGEDDDGMGKDIERSISSIVEQCKDETNDLADLFDTVWAVTPTALSPRSAHASLPNLCSLTVLRSLYSSPWFQRLWVLQECVLANNAKCYRGLNAVPFRHIALAARWIWYRTHGRLFPGDHHYSSHTIGIQNASTMWDMISTPFIVPRVLANLLLLGMRFEVTDPRDKVYAVLGLLNDDDFTNLDGGLLPDYSISLAELYTRITRTIIDDTESLFIMRVGRTLVPDTARGEDALEIPSWVPRFDWIHDVNKGSQASIRATRKASSSTSKLRMRTWEGLPWILTVEGALVDEIRHTTTGFSTLTKSGVDVLKSQVITAWDLTVANGSEKICGSLETAFAYTICAGRNKYLEDLNDDLHFDTNCAAFFSICGSACVRLSEHFSNSTKNGRRFSVDHGQEISNAIAQNSRNLSYFVTSAGRPGLGPKESRLGDSICIIPGCDVPVILRKEGAFWSYIGDAYVYGFMDGKYLQQQATNLRYFNIQ